VEGQRAGRPGGEDDEHAVEQREAGEGAEPGGEADQRERRHEQRDEGVIRDSDQGPGGQFE
jgi:hypothetical protein